jgi:hypothetical protein
MTFPRGYYIALILLLISLVAFGQDCCFNPPLIKGDTVISGSDIKAIIIEPNGFQDITITFKSRPPEIHEDFTHVGRWTQATNTADPFLNSTVSYSNTPGDQLILNFYGSKISIITATAQHHGLALVQIDNELVETINLWSAERKNNVVVYSKNVPRGTHSIRITAGAAGYTVIDYLMVSL